MRRRRVPLGLSRLGGELLLGFRNDIFEVLSETFDEHRQSAIYLAVQRTQTELERNA